MLKIKIIIQIFLLSSLTLHIYSEEHPKKMKESFTHQYLGLREGLIQSQVFYSFQDNYGYMWFATFDGVNRFDGKHFENFSNNELQIGSSIRYINQHENIIYLVSQNSIIFIYPNRNMEFYTFPDKFNVSRSGKDFQIVGDYLYLFNCYNETQQYLNLYSILRFDLKNKNFKTIADGLPIFHTFKSDTKIYAVPNEINNRKLPLYRIDDETTQIVSILELEDDYNYIVLRKTSKNEYFASLGKTTMHRYNHFDLCRFFIEKENIILEQVITMPDSFSVIENLDENRYLIWSNSLLIVDTVDKSITSFPLDTKVLWDIIVDQTGSFWFSCDDGVYHCTKKFMEYKLEISKNDDIWGVIRDINDNIWFSSYTYGFWRADKQRAIQKIYPIENHKKIDPVGYMSNCEDSKGRIYQTFHAGIAVHDPNKDANNPINAIMTGVSLATYYDADRDIVYFGGFADSIATLNSLCSNGNITTYPFGIRHIISICRDGNQNLRIGTFYGEAYLDEKNGVIVNDTRDRPYKSVICMALDNYGTLWKGGKDGLFAEDKQGKYKLINDEITLFVTNYHNKYIIFGTGNKQLHLLDLHTFHNEEKINIRTFNYYDGFDVMECGQNGVSIDHEGYVWVTGRDRAISFLPEKIMKTPIIKPRSPFLSAIYKADRSLTWNLVSEMQQLHFENKENNLRFDLLLAETSAPDKLVFRYRLKGYDDHWHTSNERSFIFQNLPVGKYILEVQSSIDDKQWSESTFSSEIKINPPFLFSIIGRLMLVICLIVIGFVIMYYIKKLILKKEEEKRKIDRIKFKAVQAKFIPHFTGNVLNSVNYLISKNPDSAQKYISDFAEFSHKTLFSSDKICRTIIEEIEYVELYLSLEKLRFAEKLEYEIIKAPDVNIQTLVPTIVLHTLCENALRHGLRPKPTGGKITIHIYNEKEYVVLAVEDNGIGREKSATLKTNGNKEGLKIFKQHMEIFDKEQQTNSTIKIIDLYNDQKQPSGTRVEVRIKK